MTLKKSWKPRSKVIKYDLEKMMYLIVFQHPGDQNSTGNWPCVSLVAERLFGKAQKVNTTPLHSTDVCPSVPYHDQGPLINDSNLYSFFSTKQTG